MSDLFDTTLFADFRGVTETRRDVPADARSWYGVEVRLPVLAFPRCMEGWVAGE